MCEGWFGWDRRGEWFGGGGGRVCRDWLCVGFCSVLCERVAKVIEWGPCSVAGEMGGSKGMGGTKDEDDWKESYCCG